MTAFRKGIHVPSRVTRVVRFANDSVTMYRIFWEYFQLVGGCAREPLPPNAAQFRFWPLKTDHVYTPMLLLALFTADIITHIVSESVLQYSAGQCHPSENVLFYQMLRLDPAPRTRQEIPVSPQSQGYTAHCRHLLCLGVGDLYHGSQLGNVQLTYLFGAYPPSKSLLTILGLGGSLNHRRQKCGSSHYRLCQSFGISVRAL
ncbi:hypothetical protein C8R48DRAFT_211371 [Suillus tomentosus]|nr:hypothetical protein C8R48DRAFT_211371 [Suillus tomentosus]